MFEPFIQKNISPILCHYILWILQQAQEKSISTLYFLARDGYILKQIADIFCNKFQLPIQTKYLYCSRFALRTPTYHLLPKEELISLLFHSGHHITPQVLLGRLKLSKAQRHTIYQEMQYQKPEDYPLSKLELSQFSQQIFHAPLFVSLLENLSKTAYETTMGYLEQEGLFTQDCIALVDTGWTGSMQRSFRQLLESKGHTPSLVGFYFGMYSLPKEAKDGSYHTFFFDATSNPFQLAKFNNNLLECFCAAPHPMTIGYQEKDGVFSPIFNPHPLPNSLKEHIENQIAVVMDHAKQAYPLQNFLAFSKEKAIATFAPNMLQMMYAPTREQALYCGAFLFCDDISDLHFSSLSQPLPLVAKKECLFVTRLVKKYIKKTKDSQALDQAFWIYGSLALEDTPISPYLRWNLLLWDALRMYRNRKRK